MSRGVFALSIDLELAWGICDRPLTDVDRRGLERERHIVRRLLDLFTKYSVRASWGIVGHLLQNSDPWNGSGLPHPQIPRPVILDESEDWFFQLPKHTGDKFWYGEDLIKAIMDCTLQQELGSHSFSHIPFDEARTNPDAVAADLRSAKQLHKAYGIPFEFLIFPRNLVGFLETVASSGIRVYRGNTSHWYEKIPVKAVHRAMRLLTFLCAGTPTIVRAEKSEHGLVNVPGSMLFLRRHGLRRFVTGRHLARRGMRGLDAAVSNDGIFHLWLHPSNFYDQQEEQFEALALILAHADALRRRRVLEQHTLGEIGANHAQDQ